MKRVFMFLLFCLLTNVFFFGDKNNSDSGGGYVARSDTTLVSVLEHGRGRLGLIETAYFTIFGVIAWR